jgi:hypothetical protein
MGPTIAATHTHAFMDRRRAWAIRPASTMDPMKTRTVIHTNIAIRSPLRDTLRQRVPGLNLSQTFVNRAAVNCVQQPNVGQTLVAASKSAGLPTVKMHQRAAFLDRRRWRAHLEPPLRNRAQSAHLREDLHRSYRRGEHSGNRSRLTHPAGVPMWLGFLA